MSEEIEGRDETKLANGGGAFPFWFSVTVVVGLLAILVAIVYGAIQLFS